jgi:hypothetical protein
MCVLAQEFLQEQDFPESMFSRFFRSSRCNYNHARAASLHFCGFFSRVGHSLLFSLFAIMLLQCSNSLLLLRYFSEFCNTLFAIHYTQLCSLEQDFFAEFLVLQL